MNHAFASSKKNLTTELLEKDINEILLTRFKEHIVSSTRGDYIELSWKDEKISNYSILSIWLSSNRMIEMRREMHDLSSWVQSVVQNELAFRYGGKCSYECISKKIEPELKFHSFIEYQKCIYSNLEDDLIEKFINKLSEQIPKDLL